MLNHSETGSNWVWEIQRKGKDKAIIKKLSLVKYSNQRRWKLNPYLLSTPIN
jgi:hypothetical protein